MADVPDTAHLSAVASFLVGLGVLMTWRLTPLGEVLHVALRTSPRPGRPSDRRRRWRGRTGCETFEREAFENVITDAARELFDADPTIGNYNLYLTDTPDRVTLHVR